MWTPNGAKIPDLVCVISENFYGNKITPENNKPLRVRFSHKIQTPPSSTIAVVKNSFKGPFKVDQIRQSNSSFFAWLLVENAIPSKDITIVLEADLKYWALNELFLSGLIEKGGKITDGTEFVAVTYSCHSTLILKDGDIYNKITSK